MRSSRPGKAGVPRRHPVRATRLESTTQIFTSTTFRLMMDRERQSPTTPTRLPITQEVRLTTRLRFLPPVPGPGRSLRRQQSLHRDMKKCSNKALPMISNNESVRVRDEKELSSTALFRCTESL